MIRTTYLVATLLIGMSPALAMAGSGWFNLFTWHKHQSCDSTCATCRSKVETEKVEKTCFETECKQICVPKVTFPWQKHHTAHSCDSGCCDAEHCAPKYGRVINVNTLKKRKYECEKCVHKWVIEPGAACCEGRGTVRVQNTVAPPTDENGTEAMDEQPPAPPAPPVPTAQSQVRRQPG